MFLGKTINKVNVFHNWNFKDVTGQLWEEKTFNSFVIFLLRTFSLVSGTYDTSRFFSYQNLGNVPLMFRNYIRNFLFNIHLKTIFCLLQNYP